MSSDGALRASGEHLLENAMQLSAVEPRPCATGPWLSRARRPGLVRKKISEEKAETTLTSNNETGPKVKFAPCVAALPRHTELN